MKHRIQLTMQDHYGSMLRPLLSYFDIINTCEPTIHPHGQLLLTVSAHICDSLCPIFLLLTQR